MSYTINGTRVVRNSGNRKTGPMAATYREVGPTCPTTCGILGHGCYAQRGHVAIWASQTPAEHVGDLDEAAGMDIVRHVVSGDWFKPWGKHRRLDREYIELVIEWHQQNPRTLGYGYTHGFEAWDRAGLGPGSGVWPANFLVLASCEEVARRDAAIAAGWRTARVIDEADERDAAEVLCPYDKAKHLKETPRVTCRTCRLCWEPAGSEQGIAFLKL